MPTFEEYVEVEAEMNISPKEFVQACDEDDIDELIQAIQKSKHYKTGIPLAKSDNLFDEEWNEVIKKLANSRLTMSIEDIEVIKTIAGKL